MPINHIPPPKGWSLSPTRYTATNNGDLIAAHPQHAPMRYDTKTDEWETIELKPLPDNAYNAVN